MVDRSKSECEKLLALHRHLDAEASVERVLTPKFKKFKEPRHASA